MANEVLTNTTSASLDWNDVSGATKYHCQISEYQSMLNPEYDNNALAISAATHTLTGGEKKYWWRWRAYVSATWQPWSEVSSFIYNSSLASSMTVTNWRWVNKSDITDYYDWELFLRAWEITPEHYHRASSRNRRGQLLTEWYATKTRISMDVSRSYLGSNEKAEVMRFHSLHTSFYCVTRLDNQTQTDYVYHAFEAEFRRPPELDKPGRNILELEEV